MSRPRPSSLSLPARRWRSRKARSGSIPTSRSRARSSSRRRSRSADDAAQAARLIRAREGFKVTVFARDLVNPRMLAVSPDGDLYATRRSVGDVVMLRDADGDGRADGAKTVASRPGMHGIAFDGDTVFLATVNDVYVADVAAGRQLRAADADHQRPARRRPASRTARSRSARTACSTSRPARPATPAPRPTPRARRSCAPKPDGSSRTIFAKGLRNTIGFDWEPETGALWGFDHGIDWLGDEAQVEELNQSSRASSTAGPTSTAWASSTRRTIRPRA